MIRDQPNNYLNAIKSAKMSLSTAERQEREVVTSHGMRRGKTSAGGLNIVDENEHFGQENIFKTPFDHYSNNQFIRAVSRKKNRNNSRQRSVRKIQIGKIN